MPTMSTMIAARITAAVAPMLMVRSCAAANPSRRTSPEVMRPEADISQHFMLQ